MYTDITQLFKIKTIYNQHNNLSKKLVIIINTLSFFGLLPLTGVATAEFGTFYARCHSCHNPALRVHQLMQHIHTQIHSLRTILFVQFTYTACLWMVGETGASWLSRDSNQGPSCCEATVLPIPTYLIPYSLIIITIIIILTEVVA